MKDAQTAMIEVAEAALLGIPEQVFSPRVNPLPGQAYLRLSLELRDSLAQLRSQDIACLRLDSVYYQDHWRWRQFMRIATR